MSHEDLTDFTSPFSKNKEKLLNIGPEDMKSVFKHYNVTAEDVNEMVRSIKDWLKKQPHMPGDKLHDRQIIGHLMLRGFSVEKVKSNLDDYFRAPHKMPDIVCQRDPMDPTIAEYMKLGYWACMPKKTPEDYRVTFCRMIPSTKTTNITSIIKVAFMYMEYRTWNEASLGDCWIFDMEHCSLQDTLQMTPVLISNIVFFVMACYGVRLKRIYVINLPPITVPLFNLFKRLAKEKIGNRMFLTTNEELIKIFPKECLPNDYGGEGGNFKELADELRKTMQTDAWRQYFLELENVRTDESKRVTPLPENEIFGADGSFRKITID